MVIETSEKLEIVGSFDDLNLREELLRGVYAYGFDKPSAV
jgi:superfamily II DNA/RNA helicase